MAKPKTFPLEQGTDFDLKRMEASDGAVMPRHQASLESALVVIEGSVILKLDDEAVELHAGESRILPTDVWHELTANPAFKAIHVMPKGITFDFGN